MCCAHEEESWTAPSSPGKGFGAAEAFRSTCIIAVFLMHLWVSALQTLQEISVKQTKRLVICSGIPDAENCSLHLPERRLIPGRAGISPAWCLPSLYLSGLRLIMALWRGLKLSFDFPIAPDLCCQLGKPVVGVAGLRGVGEQSRRDEGPFSWVLLWLRPPLASRWLTMKVLSIFYWNRDVEFRIENCLLFGIPTPKCNFFFLMCVKTT